MAFNFFGFRKTPVVEDAVVKDKPVAPKTFDEALAAQEAAQVAAQVAVKPALNESEVKPQEADQPESSETAAAPLPLGQLDQLEATREDVIAAYKIFLGRLPESEAVLDTWIGVKSQALLADFLKSAEFLANPQKAQFILALAKKILDDRKQAATAEGAAPAEQGPPAT